MFNIIICRSREEMGSKAFEIMNQVIQGKNQPVLGLATGSSPLGLYQKMIAAHQKGLSFQNCITFNLDEYIGLPKDHQQSYYTFMHQYLFNEIDIPEKNIHIPDGNAADEEKACVEYENEIKQYTIDLQVLGIGSAGHIAFNEPGTPFDILTHIMKLQGQTRQDNARFFEGNLDLVPTSAITQGLATIMRAKKIILLASGSNKAQAVHDMILGPFSEDCPASILQRHPDITVILDKSASAKLA